MTANGQKPNWPKFSTYFFTMPVMKSKPKEIIMKKIMLLTVVLITFLSLAKAQKCAIQIQILEDKYMFGEATILPENTDVNKMEVDFTSDYLEVILPLDGQNYLIKVINQDCQAFCSKEKRVRQLHSGDEKIVRNLFKDKESDILDQIKACSF